MRIIRLFISLSIFSLLVGCKQATLKIRSDSTDKFSSIISQIDKETYNEIDWLTEEPTGGVIVYVGYKFLDIDNDGKAELLYLDGEPLMTQAFEGGHFGTFYFLFGNGKMAKYDSSYWEENLAIYDKLKIETLISYTGDMNTGEWDWEIDKKKINKSAAIKIIKNINIYGG